MYTTASIHTAAAWSRSVFRIIPGDIIWGGGGGGRGEEEFISRNHGGLAGWFLPSKANPRCGRQRRRRRPPWTFGPCIYIYIYFIRVFFPPRLQFLVPSTLARMPQDFAVSFQQLDKSCRLLRVIPKKILPRNRRKVYTE